MRWSRFFPRPWRDRYGEEVDDLLKHSSRPLRDRADVIIGAFEARWHHAATLVGHSDGTRRVVRAVAGVLVVTGVVGAAWAQGRLAHGFVEIPGHWWSSLAVSPTFVGMALAALAWTPRRL